MCFNFGSYNLLLLLYISVCLSLATITDVPKTQYVHSLCQQGRSNFFPPVTYFAPRAILLCHPSHSSNKDLFKIFIRIVFSYTTRRILYFRTHRCNLFVFQVKFFLKVMKFLQNFFFI